MNEVPNLTTPQKIKRLVSYVSKHKTALLNRNGKSVAQCASEASTECGYKVSPTWLGQEMRDQGIPTKRTGAKDAKIQAMENEIEKLTEEKSQLVRSLAMMASSQHIPTDLRELALAGLNDDVRKLLLTVTVE